MKEPIKRPVTERRQFDKDSAPVHSASPSGDAYNCNNFLDGYYAYSLTVGNGNYINIQGNDPEITKVRPKVT